LEQLFILSNAVMETKTDIPSLESIGHYHDGVTVSERTRGQDNKGSNLVKGQKHTEQTGQELKLEDPQ